MGRSGPVSQAMFNIPARWACPPCHRAPTRAPQCHRQTSRTTVK